MHLGWQPAPGHLYWKHMLIRLPIAVDSQETTLQLDGDRLYKMKRNVRKMLETPQHPRVVYHQCTDFDVMDAILSRPKRQPESNLRESFEKENEPTLQSVTGEIVIINDR